MARAIPSAPKVHTTNYANFKGVDFTNDPTNVWYRRSPDGVNMLPDDAGRPFKRAGWEIAVNAGQLADIINVEELRILKCHYFELAGIDHILIFTDGGVFRYADVNNDGIPEVDIMDASTFGVGAGDSKDIDCYSGFDRAFFFEGNGTAGFYIYGNYKVWVYGYDVETEEFTFNLAHDGFEVGNITIPTVLASTDPSSCTGTVLYAYNLIGSKASVEYPNNTMFYSYTTSTTFTFTANDKSKFESPAYYEFTYSSGSWSLDGYKVVSGAETPITGSNVNLSTYGIVLTGTETNGDKIVVIQMYGTLLPNNVTQYQVGENEVSVYPDFQTHPEIKLTVEKEYDTSTPPNRVHPQDDTECVLHTDVDSPNNKAWVEFYSSIVDADQKDIIRVVFPVATVTIHSYSDEAPINHTITINGKGA